MPKYFQDKVAGYYLYYTKHCIVEAMHAHASDKRMTIFPDIILKCIKDGLRIVRTDFMNAENYRQECTNSLAVFL